VTDVAWFVVVVLAVYRLTRLVTADRIMDWFRAWVEARSGWAAYLVTCDWCLSIWVAPPVVWVGMVWGELLAVRVVFGALAASALTGLLSLSERRLDK
jgi:hypothetical protein